MTLLDRMGGERISSSEDVKGRTVILTGKLVRLVTSGEEVTGQLGGSCPVFELPFREVILTRDKVPFPCFEGLTRPPHTARSLNNGGDEYVGNGTYYSLTSTTTVRYVDLTVS